MRSKIALTHPKVREVIQGRAQGPLDYFNSTAPAGGFPANFVLPDAITTDHIMLEGERINILEPMHGDTPR